MAVFPCFCKWFTKGCLSIFSMLQFIIFPIFPTSLNIWIWNNPSKVLIADVWPYENREKWLLGLTFGCLLGVEFIHFRKFCSLHVDVGFYVQITFLKWSIEPETLIRRQKWRIGLAFNESAITSCRWLLDEGRANRRAVFGKDASGCLPVCLPRGFATA